MLRLDLQRRLRCEGNISGLVSGAAARAGRRHATHRRNHGARSNSHRHSPALRAYARANNQSLFILYTVVLHLSQEARGRRCAVASRALPGTVRG